MRPACPLALATDDNGKKRIVHFCVAIFDYLPIKARMNVRVLHFFGNDFRSCGKEVSLSRSGTKRDIAASRYDTAATGRYVSAIERYIAATCRYIAAIGPYCLVMTSYLSAIGRYCAEIVRYSAGINPDAAANASNCAVMTHDIPATARCPA